MKKIIMSVVFLFVAYLYVKLNFIYSELVMYCVYVLIFSFAIFKTYKMVSSVKKLFKRKDKQLIADTKQNLKILNG